MSSVLVTIAELKAFLNLDGTSQDVVLQSVLDGVEAQFLADCNRRERPFTAAAQAGRIEVHAGTGDCRLALDYAPAAITTILLGRDTSDPVETLDPSDLTILSWAAGKRTLTRVDGGIWGCYNTPAYVHVTYDAQADFPELPKIAIKRAVAAIYRQLGAEDLTHEQLSTYQRDLRQVYEGDRIWQAAVNASLDLRF